MSETLDLLFRIQTQGIDALDKAAGSTKAIGIETKYSSAELQQFDKILGVVTGSGANYRKALEDIAKSGKQVGQSTADIAKELLGLDKQFQKTADEAEKSAKRQQEAFKSAAASLQGGIQDPFSALKGSAESALASFGPMGVAIIGIGTAAVVAGHKMFDLAAAAGSLAEAQLNTAARTGLTVKEVGLFSTAAENAGVNASGFTTAMRTLSRALSENSDEGKNAKRSLEDIGVTVYDQFGNLKSTGNLYKEIADHLGAIEDPAKRADLAISIFGRAGLELLPLLNGEFREGIELLKKMGVGFDDVTANQMAHFDDALDILSTRIKVMWREAGVGIATAMQHEAPSLFDQKEKNGQYSAQNVDNKAIEESKRRAMQRRAEYLATQGATTLPPMMPIAPNPAFLPQLPNRREFARERISAMLAEGNGLTEKLKKAHADLTKAVKDDDEPKVIAAKAAVDGIKAQIEAQKQSKQIDQERLTLLKELASVQRGVLSGTAAINAKYDDQLSDLTGRGKLSGGNRDIIEQTRTAALEKEEKLETDKGNKLGEKIKADREKRLREMDVLGFESVNVSNRLGKDSSARELAARKDEDKYGDLGGVSTSLGRVLSARSASSPITNSEGQVTDAGQPSLTRQATSQDLLKQAQDNEKHQARLLEVNSRPGGELATQKAISDLRLQTAAKILEYELNIAKTKGNQAVQDQAADDAREKAAQTVKDIHAEDALKQAEAQRRNAEEGRSIGSSFAEAALGGGNGIRGFAQSEGKKLLSQAAGNATGPLIERGLGAIRSNIPSDGAFGKVLAGTILDPNKGIDGNTKSLIAQTTATDKLTAATDNLAGNLSGTGGGSGGGSASGGPGGLSRIIDDAFGSILPPGAKNAFDSLTKLGTPFSSSAIPSTSSSFDAGGFVSDGTTSGTPVDFSDLQKSGQGSMSSSSAAAAGVGKYAAAGAAIAGGAMLAFDGFKKGGAKGALEGTAGVLEGAAGIASLIPGGQLVGAVLGAVGGVVGIVGSLLGDPKKQYLDTMQKLAQENQYQAPTSITKSQGLNGNYSDTDAQGNARSSDLSAMPRVAESYYDWMKSTNVPGSVLSPFGGSAANPGSMGTNAPGATDTPPQGQQGPQVIINVNTMDSKSFMDNRGLLTNAMHAAITEGHPVIDEMRAQLNPGYAG